MGFGDSVGCEYLETSRGGETREEENSGDAVGMAVMFLAILRHEKPWGVCIGDLP